MQKLTVEEMGRMSSAEFKSSSKLPVTVVLDNVRSLYNVGSVFRTSDAFRVERIILCGITATPDNCLMEIHKTALGAEQTVEWVHVDDTLQSVKGLIEEGYTAVAIEQVHDSIKLQDLQLDKSKKYALILGNEVKGVQQSVVDICPMCVEIPQFGTKHSLNVSVSAGIVIWEFARLLLM